MGSGTSAAVLAVSEVKAPEPQPEPEQSAAPQTPGLPPLPGAAESLPPLPGAGKRRMSLATVTLAGGKLDLGVDAEARRAAGVAAAEVVIGLAIVVAVMRRRPKASIDEVSVLRG